MPPRPHLHTPAEEALPLDSLGAADAGALATEEVPCPLCGVSELDRVGHEEPPFRAVRCRCGFWYLSPRLAESAMVGAYRDDGYFEGEGLGYSSYLAQEATLRRTFRRLLRTLERRGMTGGALLEVGCAYGFFLDEARERFGPRVGTEYSPAAAERARERTDRVVLGGLDELDAGDRFRLAACIHVIEHVYDPVGFVRRLHDHLEPGGWVVVATPDMGGFWRPLLGRRWPFYKMPEHVTYFDRESLGRLLEAGGFEDVRPIPYASYFAFDLVAEKLGVRLPDALSRLWLRLPATTVALAGRRPGGSGRLDSGRV